MERIAEIARTHQADCPCLPRCLQALELLYRLTKAKHETHLRFNACFFAGFDHLPRGFGIQGNGLFDEDVYAVLRRKLYFIAVSIRWQANNHYIQFSLL